MLSSISVKENHRIGSNSSEVAPEQALNGVVGADLRPNETMNEDEEVDINGDDDEVANAWALQPIKNRLQDIPLSSLDEKCLSTLRKKLDIDRPEGRNYLELASRLFPEKSYDSLLYDVRKMPSPTSYLVRKLCKEKGQQATVFTLVEALFGMGRFDAIQDILRSFERIADKRKSRGFKASKLLTIMRKRRTKNPDTVSNLSVDTTTSSESYCSLEAASFHVVVGNYQFPPRPNYQARDTSFSDLTENTKQPDPNAIFVVSASDETQLCVMLVHWLRKKGFDATCVETGNMEQGSSPFQYVERWCKNASMVIVVCSPKFKEVVSDEINTTHLNYNDLAIRAVYYSLCHDFFESGRNRKYIPLMKPGTSRSCAVSPLNYTAISIFQQNDKDSREELIRRLTKQERYTLGPIGPKPTIKPKLITGNIADLRK